MVLGTVGGIGIVLGTGGLLWLKRHSDRVPEYHSARGMDVAFLVLLFLTSLTGLVLLALRETPVMGTLLVVHLGVVAGLFLTLPMASSSTRFFARLRSCAFRSRVHARFF